MKPATGDWRYDVENAPVGIPLMCDQSDICEESRWTYIFLMLLEDGKWVCGNMDCEHEPPWRYAVPNSERPFVHPHDVVYYGREEAERRATINQPEARP